MTELDIHVYAENPNSNNNDELHKNSDGPNNNDKLLHHYCSEKIKKFLFSPKMKCIVTWSEVDESIIVWSVTNGENNLKPETYYKYEGIVVDIVSISDNKHVSVLWEKWLSKYEL